MKDIEFNIIFKNDITGLNVNNTPFLAINHIFINQNELIQWIKDSLMKNLENMPKIEI